MNPTTTTPTTIVISDTTGNNSGQSVSAILTQPEPQMVIPAKSKHHPGDKGTTVMNTRTKEEQKDYRRQVIEMVRVLIGQGYSYEMKKEALASHFQVSGRQAKTYIRWFHEDFQKRKQEASERSFAIQKIRLEHLYQKNMKDGNLKEARECLKEIAALEDLNQKTHRLHINTQVEVRNDLSQLSEDQLLELEKWLNTPGSQH